VKTVSCRCKKKHKDKEIAKQKVDKVEKGGGYWAAEEQE
jgi:hypothetical protein